MERINILDCTLRDGGYINNFKFGEQVQKNIVSKLAKASIDIIECGWLKSNAFDKDYSQFGSIETIKNIIGKKNHNLMYVAMLQFGAISVDEIADYDRESIDGIRLTFHEHEIDEAFILGQELIKKGYKLFMQPVGTTTYTDEALLKLIDRINLLKPFAFYMVDTLGVMYQNDLMRMFYLLDHNLNKNIAIGFHSHNNLQLSFANAQMLMQLNVPRTVIIDTSIYGMGRGAGNLNTELVTQFYNKNFKLKYDNTEIIELIDEYIKPISIKYKWGYDVAYYIASITNCHPNYALFLLNKQTLMGKDIYAILKSLDKRERGLFNKDYIANVYKDYMGYHIDDTDALNRIKEKITGRKLILLAPGKSLNSLEEEIKSLIKNNGYYAISVNFIPEKIDVDMMFISNMRRFKSIADLKTKVSNKMIVVATSNITTNNADNLINVDYTSYTNEEDVIYDNAGLMCINLLNKIEIKEILLAGFDGFSKNIKDNYLKSNMYVDVQEEQLQAMNIAITSKLRQLSKQINIKFLQSSLYDVEGNKNNE